MCTGKQLCMVMALVGFLIPMAHSTEGTSNGTTVVNCTVDIARLNHSPSFFNVPDGHEAMKQMSTNINITTPPGVQECKLDIGQVVERLPEDEVMVLYTKLICPEHRKFQLILENAGRVRRMEGIGYLWSVSCKIFWKHMAVYGQAVDLRVLYLEKWEDQFDTELERFGTLPDSTEPYEEGIGNVGSLAFLHRASGAPASDVPLPRILREYSWPKMAEMNLFNISYASLPEAFEPLRHTMPRLQTLGVQFCSLTEAPTFFPWDDDVFHLPRNLSRSPIGNDHYSHAIGIDVKPHEYRRLFQIDYNAITNLTDVEFRGLFDAIILKSNGLKAIGAKTFRGTRHVQVLDLSINRLETIPKTTFHGLDDLVHLDLSNNQLTALQPETFRDLPSLTTISLRNNQLASIDAGFFSHVLSLEQIDVSSNNLTHVDEGAVLVHSDRLQAVNFAKNQLTVIPTWLFLVRNLRSVDLSDNFISFESFRSTLSKINSEFIAYQNRQTASSYSGTDITVAREKAVNLQRNNFTAIPVHELNEADFKTFSLLLMFFHMDVEGNPITCDCNSFSFYEYLSPEGQAKLHNPPPQRNIDSWKCSSPAHVKGVTVAAVPATTFQCPGHFPDCPEKCTCYERSVDNVVEVDCRNRSLTRIPETVPAGTKVLYLDKNGISKVSGVYSYFQNLTTLTLSYNNVSKISDSALGAMTSLTHLSLQNNRLQYLPRTLEQIDLESITLKNNPMVCDCHSKWVKYWLLATRHVVGDMEDILCTAGKPQGKHFVEAKDNEYVCEISKEGRAAIGLAVFIVVTSLVFVIVYKFRGEIKLFLYVHFNWHPFDKSDDDDAGKLYDAFVSYSGIDYRWVCHILRKRVELREPPYRLCLHDRDFMPGHPIQENIQNAINDSRRMIIILSKNYIQSEWCLYEFRAAHHKVMKERSNFLIVIKCSDVTMNDLDEDLQLYLRTNTYLDVSNKWFWEKLFYTLPQNPLSVLNDDARHGQEKVIQPKTPAIAAAGLTSPLTVPPEACQPQMDPCQFLTQAPMVTTNYGAIHSQPIGNNMYQTQPQQANFAMPQQSQVVLVPCPQQPPGGNAIAFIPYQMNLCTPWPVNGCVQAPTGQMLYQANGYMPFPGNTLLPEGSDPAGEGLGIDGSDGADGSAPTAAVSSQNPEPSPASMYTVDVEEDSEDSVDVTQLDKNAPKEERGSKVVPVSPDSATPLLSTETDVTSV